MSLVDDILADRKKAASGVPSSSKKAVSTTSLIDSILSDRAKNPTTPVATTPQKPDFIQLGTATPQRSTLQKVNDFVMGAPDPNKILEPAAKVVSSPFIALGETVKAATKAAGAAASYLPGPLNQGSGSFKDRYRVAPTAGQALGELLKTTDTYKLADKYLTEHGQDGGVKHFLASLYSGFPDAAAPLLDDIIIPAIGAGKIGTNLRNNEVTYKASVPELKARLADPNLNPQTRAFVQELVNKNTPLEIRGNEPTTGVRQAVGKILGGEDKTGITSTNLGGLGEGPRSTSPVRAQLIDGVTPKPATQQVPSRSPVAAELMAPKPVVKASVAQYAAQSVVAANLRQVYTHPIAETAASKLASAGNGVVPKLTADHVAMDMPDYHTVAPSVVQVASKGNTTFYTVKPENFAKITEMIDSGSGKNGQAKAIAGESLGVKQDKYHITAIPEIGYDKFFDNNFQYKGEITPELLQKEINASRSNVKPSTTERTGLTKAERSSIVAESQRFPDTQMEANYKKFVNQYSKYKTNVPEDATQYKELAPQHKDLFYSQEHGDEQVFDMFRDRYENRNSSSAFSAAKGNTVPLATFEANPQAKIKGTPEFKVYEQTQKLVEKYAKRIGERYQGAKNRGVFFHDSKNIFVNSLNNVSTVSHEVTHFLDDALGSSKEIIKDGPIVNKESGLESVSKRDKAAVRKALTDVYVKYYAGGSPQHSLTLRVQEGIATFLQRYVEAPTMTKAEFPLLVKEFLTPGGKFYKPEYQSLITDVRNIVDEFHSLDSLDQVSSVMTNDPRVTGKPKVFNLETKVFAEMFDDIATIESLDEKAGGKWNDNAAHIKLRAFRNSPSAVMASLSPEGGMWAWDGNAFVKVNEYNIADLYREIEKMGVRDQFGAYLTARDTAERYIELDDLQQQIKDGEDPFDYEEDSDLVKAKERVTALKEQLAKEPITRKQAEEAYRKNEERFADLAEKYDQLNENILDMVNDAGYLTPDMYQTLQARKGYATRKRDFTNIVIGDADAVARVNSAGSGISTMKGRSGSEAVIINPLMSLPYVYREAMLKGVRASVNKAIVGTLTELGGDLIQKLPTQVSVDNKGQVNNYPQRQDPNVIETVNKGKHSFYLVDKEVKNILDEIVTVKNIGAVEKISLAVSRQFTKGTTALDLPFALTNFMYDQSTAFINSQQGYIPFYDGLKQLSTMVNPNNPAHELFQEYLTIGGHNQVLAHMGGMTPSEVYTAIAKEKEGLAKLGEWLGKGTEALTTVSKYSEFSTRFAEYLKARRSGDSQQVALEKAGRVTAPFHHIGRLKFGSDQNMQVWVKSAVFVNPGLQAFGQFYQTLKTPAGRQRFALLIGALIAATVGTIYAFSKADEQTQRKYKEIDPVMLTRYVYLPIQDSKGRLYRIPVSREAGFVAALVNMAISDYALKGKKYSVSDYVAAGTSVVPDSINITDPKRMVLTDTPYAISLAMQALFGKKVFPHVQDIEPKSAQYQLPGHRYTEYTSPFSKKLGAMTGLSPIKLDYFITGTLGRAVNPALGNFNRLNPLEGFSQSNGFGSGRSVQQFYDNKAMVQQTISTLKKEGKPKEREYSAWLGKSAEIDAKMKKLNEMDFEKDRAAVDNLRLELLQKIEALNNTVPKD